MGLAKKMQKRVGIMKIHSYSTNPPSREKVKTRTVTSISKAEKPNGGNTREQGGVSEHRQKQPQPQPQTTRQTRKGTAAANLSPELENRVNRLAAEAGKRTRQQQLPGERTLRNSGKAVCEEKYVEVEEDEEFSGSASKRRRQEHSRLDQAKAASRVDTRFIKQEVIVDEEEHELDEPTVELVPIAEDDEDEYCNNEDDGTSSSTASAEEDIGEEMEHQKGSRPATTTTTRNPHNSLKVDRGSSSVTRASAIIMTEEDYEEQQDQEQQQPDEEEDATMDDYEATVVGPGGGGTSGGGEDMEDTDGALTGNRLFRKKVKRKVHTRTNSASVSSSLAGSVSTTTSSRAKLQMLQEFPTLFIGLRRNRMFLVNSLAQSFDLNQRDIVLTLRKIKQNESSARLANFFGVGAAEVDLLFHTSVPKIADCLRNFIVWPDDFTMKLNVPISLRQHFNRIHLILNYLVLRVKQNAVQHLPADEVGSAYCPLDQCHKLKYLVASTLDGCVCFVSRAFGVQTDDEQVLSRSGFLTKFKTNTNLIAGQNFHNFEDRLANGHDHTNNNGGGDRRNRRTAAADDDDSDLERVLGNCDEDNFEDIVSEKISKSRTFKLKNYIENILENFQNHQMLSPHTCIDGRTFKLLDDIVVIVGALINLQKQEID